TEDRLINNPSAALLEGDLVKIVTPRPGYDMINESVESREKSKPVSSHSEIRNPGPKQALDG
ncbi:MAG: efflux RND transporter periplasmic adaptor subunit, partial [Nitrosomonas sp.]